MLRTIMTVPVSEAWAPAFLAIPSASARLTKDWRPAGAGKTPIEERQPVGLSRLTWVIVQLSRKCESGTPSEARLRHPQHDAVAGCRLPHCVVGLFDGNLITHERGALLEDRRISLRVGLVDEGVEVDRCVIKMRGCNG